MKFIFLLLFCTIFTIADISATRYASPRNKNIPSQNKLFNLLVDYSHSNLKVSEVNNKIMWEYKLNKIWHHKYFLSNDGSTVVIVNWEFMKIKNINMTAIKVIKNGELHQEFSFKETSIPIMLPERTKGPIGDFWRIWRNNDIKVIDQILHIPVTKKEVLKVSLKSGNII
jgi:hypothetical protein